MKESSTSFTNLSNKSIKMQSSNYLNQKSNNCLQEALKPQSVKQSSSQNMNSNDGSDFKNNLNQRSGVYQEPFNHDYMAYG